MWLWSGTKEKFHFKLKIYYYNLIFALAIRMAMKALSTSQQSRARRIYYYKDIGNGLYSMARISRIWKGE